MRIILPDIPKSPNRRRGEHWVVSKRYANYWKDLVRSQIEHPGECTIKMRVSISQMRKRTMDRDNLIASCKPLIDALTHWKLIKDDSEKWIDLDVRQVIGKEKITVVEVVEL